MKLWFTALFLVSGKLPRLSSELLDESNDPDSPCGHISAQDQSDEALSHCSQHGSQRESLLHFFSIFPKFHHARTAAHNQVCKVLATSLRTHLATHWSLFKETRLSSTGLALELVPADVVLQSGRHIPDSDAAAAEISLVRWQPDFIAISYTSKKIAIGPEVCQLADISAENLVEAIGKYKHTILSWWH